MAYTKAWDEAAPVGATTPANTIDTLFQDLKISVRERLDELIPDFSNDAVDPKTLGAGIFADGTVGAPSIAPRSWPDTGWYWPADGQISFASNGVRVFGYSTLFEFLDDVDVTGYIDFSTELRQAGVVLITAAGVLQNVDISAADIVSGNLAFARLPTGGGTWAVGGALVLSGGSLAWGGGAAIASSDDVPDLASAETWAQKQTFSGGIAATQPAVRVYRTTPQSLTTGTDTPINWEAESFDTDALHDGVNPSRLTVPAGDGGKYLITAQLAYATNATGNRWVRIRKNGATIIAEHNIDAQSTSTFVSVTEIANLAAGDYIEIIGFQNSGGALDVLAVESQCYAAMYQLG